MSEVNLVKVLRAMAAADDRVLMVAEDPSIIDYCARAADELEARLDSVSAVLDEFRVELHRAEAKFPTFPTDPIHAATVVSEESGELAQAALQLVYEGGTREAMRKEAVQMGAMALRFLLHEPLMRCQPCEQLAREAAPRETEG